MSALVENLFSTPVAGADVGAAARLRQLLGCFSPGSDDRAPRIAAQSRVPAPPDADWSWRPALWQQLVGLPKQDCLASGVRLGADGLALFHDSAEPALAARQLCRRSDQDRSAGFDFELEVLRFDGSFLSIALDLPSDAVSGLSRRHVFGIDTAFDAKLPLKAYVRLNIRHGPNIDQMVQEIRTGTGEATVEFDLAYVDFDAMRVTAIWADLILDRPLRNRITLRDLTMYRRWRAEI